MALFQKVAIQRDDGFMTLGWKDWKLTDVALGIIIPTVVGLLIVGVSMFSTPALTGLDVSHKIRDPDCIN